MKKVWLTGIVLFTSFHLLFAQRVLEAKETTVPLSVFREKDRAIDEAGGVQAGADIYCPVTLNLSFRSTLDSIVDVYKTEERGGVRLYRLRFIVGYKNQSYKNRVLEVLAQDFQPLKIKLDLIASELKSFEVFDPNAMVGVGCFYQHFNEGIELLKKALYVEAREKYRLSAECTDIPADLDIAGKIADIDSILIWRREADKYYEMLSYKDAMVNYQKIIALNIFDELANIRAGEMNRKYLENCKKYYDGAEIHFANGNYEEARKMYEIVVFSSCDKAAEANLRLKDIRKIESDRNKRIQAILYEFSAGTPIGISAGKYKEKIFAGYFSLRFNTELIEAMRKNYDKSEKSELNISAGWTTMKLHIPAWAFFGMGYTGVAEWDYDDEDAPEKEKPTFHVHNAISPELGVLGKIGPVALRYTFQYRFALEKDYQEYIGNVRHVFGVGICF